MPLLVGPLFFAACSERDGDVLSPSSDAWERGPDRVPGLGWDRPVYFEYQPGGNSPGLPSWLTMVDDQAEGGFAVVQPAYGVPSYAAASLLTSQPEIQYATPEPGVQVPEAQGLTISFNDGLTISFNDGSITSETVGTQSFLADCGIELAQANADGQGIRVAILDTGVDPTHPDLASQIVPMADYVDGGDPWEVVTGVDADEDGLADEAHGHGTHVAGLVRLTAPEASLLIYRVLDSEGRGRANDLRRAMKDARDNGADVILMALGLDGSFPPLESEIRQASDEGILVVASAGNQAANSPQYPAAYADVVGVGSGGTDALTVSWFSNLGAGVDLLAPGEEIQSFAPGATYSAWSGTSQASAIVAGSVALLRSSATSPSSDTVVSSLVGAAAPAEGAPDLPGVLRVADALALIADAPSDGGGTGGGGDGSGDGDQGGNEN